MKLFFFIFLFYYKLLIASTLPHLTIVTCSFNNSLFAEKNLQSVSTQKGPPFTFIYVDDHSSDDTATIVQKSLETFPAQITTHFIQNKSRKGALANLYMVIHTLPPEEVVLILDGDDFLAQEDVVSTLLSYYQKGAWLTYGSYLDYPQMIWGHFSLPIPNEVLHQGLVRTLPWVAAAPRSFYAGLFQRIKKKDLQDNGQFLQVAYDAAIMFPLMEMAQERAIFVHKPLYLYNTENTLSDFRLRRDSQAKMFQKLQTLPSYARLEHLPLSK